jgi:endothelin-converting enzyme
MGAIMELEVRLGAATPPTGEQKDVTKYCNPITVSETHALLPQVLFDYIISQLASKGYSSKRIIIDSPTYMTALMKLLFVLKTETLQAFLVWKAVLRFATKAEDPILKPFNAFNNRLCGLDPSVKEER